MRAELLCKSYQRLTAIGNAHAPPIGSVFSFVPFLVSRSLC
jgi:hypothetical protein